MPEPFRIVGLDCGPDAEDLLRPEREEASFRSAISTAELLEWAPEADLVVLGEGTPDLPLRVREAAPGTLVVLLRSRGAGVPDHPGRYDDLLVRTRPRDIARRLDDHVRLSRLRRRFQESTLGPSELGDALSELGLRPDLVGKNGLVTPGRVALALLQDVHRLERHQSSICELMGTAHATFRYHHEPRPLVDESGRDLLPTGTLAPYCAYLKGVGERDGNDLCRASDWSVAERAFTTLRAAERVCDGGIGQYGVPVTLRFGSIRIPLAVLIVATGPLPGDDGIESAARSYGASPEILRQMASESRFWVLHPDKVSCLKETMRHLAEAVSLEVSHAYSTAFETVSGLLRQAELRRSEQALAANASELREANLRLEEKHQEIHDFTHSVTHDLKKPLGAVKTMLSMLGRGYLGDMPEKQLRAVDTASEAAEYMIRLVQDLLESSRLDSGAAALCPETIDPRELVERIVRRLKYQIDEKGIDLRIEELPPIHADVDALEKVLMNLLGNAISYIGEGPERRIVIRAEADGDRTVLVVEDTGIGIPSQSLDTIFEKFKRGSNVVDTSGTGLGLAIVKGMVEAHGGSVVVESHVGRGTTFRVDFPPSPAPADSARPDGVAEGSPDASEQKRLHPPPEGSRYGDAATSAAGGAATSAAGVSVAPDHPDVESVEP